MAVFVLSRSTRQLSTLVSEAVLPIIFYPLEFHQFSKSVSLVGMSSSA